jgi:predicted RND superfamily exporter protein
MVRFSLFLITLFKKNPLVPVSIIVVLLLFSVLRIYNTGFGRDLIQYIPENAVKTKVYLEALEHLGKENDCYVILRGDVSKIIDRIEKISDELKEMPEIVDVNYKVKDELKNFYLTTLKTKLPLYLPTQSFDEFLYRLSPAGMEEAIRKTRFRLMILGGGEIGRFDPLGLTDFIESLPENKNFLDTSSGYYLLEGTKGLVLIATVTGDARDLSFDRKLLQGIEKVLKTNLDEGENITFSITGSHAITYYEATQMKKEMKLNIFLSLLFVSIVLLIFFKKDLRIMLYAFLPVSFSIFITLGLYSFFLGSLTEAAAGFGGMLIGLGVDLPIVLYVRYLFLKSIEKSIQETSTGIWIGVLTTWATFAPMVISHFWGIKELGILTSTGIIICAVILLTLVAGFMRSDNYVPSLYRCSFIKRILLNQRTILIFIFSLLILVPFALWIIKDMRFSVDLKELGSEKNPARTALSEIIKEGNQVFLVGNAGDTEDAIKKVGEVEKQLGSLEIKNVLSINTFIPPLERQMMVIDRLKNIDKEGVIKTFIQIAKKADFTHQFIDDYIKDLREMLSVNTPVKYDEFANMEILKDKFLWSDETGTHYLIVLNNIDSDKLTAFEGITITGKEIIKEELAGFLKADALKISLIGFILVNLILFLSFRRPKDIVFVQLPILIGILFTGAFLTLTGRPIHIMSALTGVMLFGIGTDYAIHFVHHLRREKNINSVLSQTGSAVIIAALTTICGFGSLYFSSYRGLSDMGLAVAIGTAFNLILVFLFVPLYRYDKIINL